MQEFDDIPDENTINLMNGAYDRARVRRETACGGAQNNCLPEHCLQAARECVKRYSRISACLRRAPLSRRAWAGCLDVMMSVTASGSVTAPSKGEAAMTPVGLSETFSSASEGMGMTAVADGGTGALPGSAGGTGVLLVLMRGTGVTPVESGGSITC